MVRKDVPRQCAACRKPFLARKVEVDKGYAKFCSRECHIYFKSTNFEERFWSNVDKSGDCWLWTKCKDTHGYGQLKQAGKLLRAHRVSWTLSNGAIPKGRYILHKCDAPACVRPEHLFLGTAKDNSDDMIAKNRDNHSLNVKGSAHGQARLSESQVLDMRQRHKGGEAIDSLAQRYRISYGHAWGIIRRKYWAHLP